MVATPGAAAAQAAPDVRVWCLLGQRRGDNQQVLALAEALGEPYAIKQLRFARGSRVPNFLRRTNSLGIHVDPTTPIVAPWPNVVIAVGKRSVPMALHIRAEAGPTCRLVHLGRPSAPLHWFDLILTTPQYRLPAAAHVLSLPLPFGKPLVAPAATDAFGDTARPIVALLVGGPTKEARLDPAAARVLAAEALARAEACGGQVVATASPRTPAAVVATLQQNLPPPHRVLEWQPRAPSLYPALLAAATSILVSEDSISMLADACRSQAATIDVVRLPPTEHGRARIARWAYATIAPHVDRRTLWSRCVAFPLTSGIWMAPRDYAAVRAGLEARGMLAAAPSVRHAAIESWQATAIQRVRDLLHASAGAP